MDKSKIGDQSKQEGTFIEKEKPCLVWTVIYGRERLVELYAKESVAFRRVIDLRNQGLIANISHLTIRRK